MSNPIAKFKNLGSEGKSLVILAFLTVVPFVAMLPMFFFTTSDGYPLGAYPLGWLLGGLAGIFAYSTIVYASRKILSNDDSQPYVAVLLVFARLACYAIVLVIAGICTFANDIWGGFNAFNFWTAAGGMLPFSFISLIVKLFERDPNQNEKKEAGSAEIIEENPVPEDKQ